MNKLSEYQLSSESLSPSNSDLSKQQKRIKKNLTKTKSTSNSIDLSSSSSTTIEVIRSSSSSLSSSTKNQQRKSKFKSPLAKSKSLTPKSIKKVDSQAMISDNFGTEIRGINRASVEKEDVEGNQSESAGFRDENGNIVILFESHILEMDDHKASDFVFECLSKQDTIPGTRERVWCGVLDGKCKNRFGKEGEVYLMRVYKEGQDGCGCLAEMNQGLIDRIKASRAAGFSKDLYKNLNHEQRLMAKRAMVSPPAYDTAQDNEERMPQLTEYLTKALRDGRANTDAVLEKERRRGAVEDGV